MMGLSGSLAYKQRHHIVPRTGDSLTRIAKGFLGFCLIIKSCSLLSWLSLIIKSFRSPSGRFLRSSRCSGVSAPR